MNAHYFYIARCKDGSLYIGVSDNPAERIKRHNLGQGAKWIKQHGKAEIAYTEKFDTYLEAHHRELQIKGWSRAKKENLIKGLKPVRTQNS